MISLSNVPTETPHLAEVMIVRAMKCVPKDAPVTFTTKAEKKSWTAVRLSTDYATTLVHMNSTVRYPRLHVTLKSPFMAPFLPNLKTMIALVVSCFL